MTYLEIVNKVLRRLREREVTSVSQTAYSKLIGDFVNDAKKEVEDSWNWSVLSNTLVLTTSNGVSSYELNGAQNNSNVKDVINDTGNIFMHYKDAVWFDQQLYNNTPVSGSPSYYTFKEVATDGDVKIDVYPIPDGVYSIRVNCVIRPTELVNNTDKVLVPNQPVFLLAVAKAIEERGEDGGTSSMNAYAAGKSSLADEIAYDAARQPETTVWNVV